MSKLKTDVIRYSKKLNITNLSALRSGNISAALVFNDGSGNGACDGNDFYPGHQQFPTHLSTKLQKINY